MTKKNIGLIAASFDPITNGHINIIERASRICDKLYIALTVNSNKKVTFSLEQKLELLNTTVKILAEEHNVHNVEIVVNKSLTVDLAKELGANILVRGIRNFQDFEYESTLSNINKELSSKHIETLFLDCLPKFKVISSSLIRELLHYKKPINQFVHDKLADLIVSFYNSSN